MAVRHRHFPRNSIPLSETLEMWVLLTGIVAAVWMIKTGSVVWIVGHVANFTVIGSFLEGFFFTSMLTTAPALVAIFETAAFVPAWKLALIGGVGAVCGDLLVFRFLKSRLVERVLAAVLHPTVRRLARGLSKGAFAWLGPLMGAIIIASPLPDELGLLMMGLSSIRLIYLIPLAFVANAAGIFLIALAAQSLN